jgi:hypothetical protein
MAEASSGLQELNRTHLEMFERIVEKARSDPAWKERYLAAPTAALQEIGVSDEGTDFSSLLGDVAGQATMVEYALLLAMVTLLRSA